MTTDIPIRRALLSVSNKEGIVRFAEQLSLLGIEIISTGGTARTLAEAGIAVSTVESLTGFPEMLDGRVKTLHPAIHGGLLGIRDEPTHVTAMEEHGIEPIDLICIDLYPFEETIATKGVTTNEAIEQIDIGGPAMIRSAAKNHAFVTVVTNPRQYTFVLEDLVANNGATTFDLRRDLAKDAFTRTAEYDTTISQWMTNETNGFSTCVKISGVLEQTLRYGENPDQAAAVYRDVQHSGPSVITAKAIAGKPLSYNNLMDAAAALELVQDLADATQSPSAAIIKHANPCGAAVSKTITEAIDKAWKCDPLAAFGGIVALSTSVDLELANIISRGEKFLEVVVAKSFSQEATAALCARWKNIRLLAVGSEPRTPTWRQHKSIVGGMLMQELTPVTAHATQWEHAAGPAPTLAQCADAQIAWICCAHLKSNSISIVDNGALIGGGMGQVDRVSAARLAIHRAGNSIKEATSPVAGSDAFFPFSDGPELLIDAGIQCIVHPGGSVRDQETIDICNKNSVTLLHTGIRRFRH